jgi:ectoine hydroxylase-related dioxygenase (phytanoyl-CoA dioxygenase family)
MLMPTIAPTVVLTQDQIDFYHREGYLALDAITTPEEVAWLREIYDRLFAAQAGRDVGDQFDLAGTDAEGQPATLPQILNPSRYAPELGEGLYRVNALAIARQLLGPDAEFRGEHAIFKPAHTGAETPWHQDEAYWDPGLEYESLSVWIPLQEATLENGCMQFVPGSHRQEVAAHHSIHHDPRIHGLEVDAVNPSTAVACPIPAGGATIHHNRTLHYAGPNHSDIPRRAYILIFGRAPRKRTEARDFYWQRQKKTARQQRADQVRRTAKAET